jgi:ApbE superfamily uncharacterized protein (UPF0280 family)
MSLISKHYTDRTYRNKISCDNLYSFQIKFKETDLHISSDKACDYDLVLHSVLKYRRFIENYINTRPIFLDSLIPIDADDFAPPIIKDMIYFSSIAGVGPMATVAGAIAQYVGNDLLSYSNTIVVENGGDIFMKLHENDLSVGIFAGESPLSYKLNLNIRSETTPLGICTSSGTVGHSLSMGKADAVCIVSESAILSDAAATRIGNSITGEDDIEKALDIFSEIEGITGVVVIINEKLGVFGEIELS